MNDSHKSTTSAARLLGYRRWRLHLSAFADGRFFFCPSFVSLVFFRASELRFQDEPMRRRAPLGLLH